MVEQKVVNLALQGGGSHGAFTWGVLDRLLEEERLSFEGITASRAGSVNAAVLAHGLAVGGRDEARRALQRFWKRISETTALGVLRNHGTDALTGKTVSRRAIGVAISFWYEEPAASKRFRSRATSWEFE